MQFNQRTFPQFCWGIFSGERPRQRLGAAARRILGSRGVWPNRFLRQLRSYPYLPAYLTLLLALGATAVSAWVASNSAHEKALSIVRSDAASLRDSVTEVMRGYGQVLRSSAGYVNASGPPTRERWHTFFRSLELDRHFPGIQGLGYVEVIPKDHIQNHVLEQRRRGRSEYVWGPPGERELYTSIIYLEPEDWRNLRAVGFDMYSEPVRRRAMQAARDMAAPVLTDVVTLVQETADSVQPGGLLYYPLYAGGFPPATVEDRRARLTGFVYGAFRLRDFVSRSFRDHAAVLERQHVQVFANGSDGKRRKIYDSSPGETETTRSSASNTSQSALTFETQADVAGQSWAVQVAPRKALGLQLDWSRPWMVLISGVIISLLIAAISASLTMARERSMASEQRLAQEVEERRLAQERAQLANSELIHRVKNTLAIVSAIASQTARHSSTLPDFIDSFRDRLASLGKVHDLLRPDPSYAPELSTFLRDILKAYSADSEEVVDSRLKIQGPLLHVPRNEAVLLSLLINELATNATKYGAWSVATGIVRVSWTVEDGGDGQVVEWLWKESGAPRRAAPTKNGFGTHVMQSIERGMRGSIAREFEPDGILYKFSFPLPSGERRSIERA